MTASTDDMAERLARADYVSPYLLRPRRELAEVEAVKCEAVADEAMARDQVGPTVEASVAVDQCAMANARYDRRSRTEAGVGSERPRSHSSQSEPT